MNLKRVEQLLREYARLRPPERLFSGETEAQLRARLAPVGTEGESEAGEPSGAAEPCVSAMAKARPRWRYRLIGAGTAVAAAVILVAVLVTAHRETSVVPGLAVDGAYDKADLFRTIRGEQGPPGERDDLFYIGVKVDRPAYVRIIVLDNHGRLESLPLDRSGSEERQVDADAETVFGGYEVESVDDRGMASRLSAFIVLASPKPLDGESLAEWIHRQSRARSESSQPESERVARELGRRFGCAARALQLKKNRHE